MQTIIISGNIGRDPETRQVGNDNVFSFSVGVKQGYGERASTNWYRCSVWGKRGQTIAQYLFKGTKVFVTGELAIGEYQGKPQLDVRVNEVEWDRREGTGQAQQPAAQRGGGGSSKPKPFDTDLDDHVPFVTCDPAHERRVRRIV